MATLTYTFEGDATGSIAAGWSHLYGAGTGAWTVETSGGGQRFQSDAVGVGIENVVCDEAGVLTDCVVEGTFKTTVATSSFGVWLRHTGDAEDDGYFIQFDASGDQIIIYEFTNDVLTTTHDTQSVTINNATDTKFKVEAVGTTIRAKCWEEPATEPAWIATATDASFASGYVVLHNSVQNVEVDNITIVSDDVTITELFYKFKDANGFVHTRTILRRPMISSQTSAYTAETTEEMVFADSSGGAFTVTMPTAVGKSGYVYAVEKTDSSANAVTVDGDGSETIDGVASITLDTQHEAVFLVSDDTNWRIIASDQRAATKTISAPVCLASYIDVKARNAENSLHGGLDSLDTGSALDSSPTDITVTAGTGKILVVVNAGSDLAGDITVTGTTVDRNTGAETGADTDTLTVDALTTDASDTDASGNTRHSFTGAYITSKWFKGSVTLSTTNLTLTDVDTYQVAFEQWNDSADIELESFDITALATNGSAWLYSYLYTLVVTGDKCDITRESSLDLPAAEVSANKYYRLRRGGLGTALDGSTDGIWVDFFPGPLASVYWEDINIKVWATITKELVLS